MIGIFDSGVGGITVVKELKKIAPNLSFVYLGDNARAPYGNHSRELIQQYAQEDVEFLLAQGAKVIVVACNTVSALAGDFLKAKFKVPIFEVITPAIDSAINFGSKRIGVIGTRGTIASGAHQLAIEKKSAQAKVFSQACPLFVPLVEENWLRRKETKTIARVYLQPLKMKHIDSLILGCTHYPMLKKIIQEKVGRRVRLIDPSQSTALALWDFLKDKPEFFQQQSQQQYYCTDIGGRFRELAESWLQEKINLKKAEL